MTENPFEIGRFLVLSSALTGMEVASLSPRNTPLGIAAQYLHTIRENIPAEVYRELLTVFEVANSASGPKAAASKVLQDQVFGPITRSIIKLWLLSTWYAPEAPSQPVRIISSQAYKEGLIWKVMQSHPMGYSMWTFGYWAEDPPALAAFIIKTELPK